MMQYIVTTILGLALAAWVGMHVAEGFSIALSNATTTIARTP